MEMARCVVCVMSDTVFGVCVCFMFCVVPTQGAFTCVCFVCVLCSVHVYMCMCHVCVMYVCTY